MSSCSTESPAEAPWPDAAGTFGLTVTVGDTRQGDAASGTPEGDYDPGQGYENYLDILGRDFRLYFFDTDDTFIAPVTVVSAIPTTGTPGSKRYLLVGTLPGTVTQTKEFKIVMAANWKDYPELKAGDPLATLWQNDDETIYTYNAEPLSATNTIPLYGIKEYSGMNLETGVRADLGTIHMLRALAKVEVRFTDANMVNTVKSVTMTRVNGKGYKAPSGVTRQSDYVHGNYDDDYTAIPHIPQGNAVVEDVPFGKDADGNFIIYVPEYDNTSDGAETSRICIEYAEEGSVPDYVDFKLYNDGDKKLDLLRNCWYRFTVSQRGLQVTLDVQPYAEVTLRPDYGLERDADGNIILRDEEGRIKKVINAEGGTIREYVFEVDKISVKDNMDRVVMVIDDKTGDRFIKNYDKIKEGVNYREGKEADPNKLLYYEWYKPIKGSDNAFYLYREYDIYKHVSNPEYDEVKEEITDENGVKHTFIKRYLYDSVSYDTMFKDSEFDRYTNVIEQWMRDIPEDAGWPQSFVDDFKALGITCSKTYQSVKNEKSGDNTVVYYNKNDDTPEEWEKRIVIAPDGSQTYY